MLLTNNALNTSTIDTREAWLLKAIESLKPHFSSKGYPLPIVRVSTGFTGSRSGYKAIGSCWANEAAEDNINQLFISPVINDTMQVLGVLVHELVHSVVGVKEGHNKVFKRCALSVGLEGKMTATTASHSLQNSVFKPIISLLGEYPHAKLTPGLSGKKKQGTRMLKALCGECGYTVRLTKTWADIALPECPCCDVEMTIESKED